MSNTKKLALQAILVAVALALSYMERFIPLQLVIPLPGVKLGLANIVSLFALYFLGWRSAFVILVLRCVLGAMFGGGVTALMFSLTGGVLSMFVMALTRHVPFFSVYGVSLCGAAAHNIGQIIVASITLDSLYIVAYLPFLLLVGLVTGMLTGAAAAAWFAALIAAGQRPLNKRRPPSPEG